MESWPHLPVLTTISTTRRLGGIWHLRQPITGQNGLLMADLWPAVTRQLRAAERPRELAIESIPSY